MSAAERLRVAFELHEFGVEMQRQRLRRQFPEAGEDEITERLADWMQTRPGAAEGDAVGSPSRRIG